MGRFGESDAPGEPQMSRREDSQHDGWVKHAGLSSRIPGAKSDVDIRIYGYLNLNSVVAKSDGF